MGIFDRLPTETIHDHGIPWPAPMGFMIMYRNQCYVPQTVHDHELSQMSEV
jgi:hypothetical protein